MEWQLSGVEGRRGNEELEFNGDRDLVYKMKRFWMDGGDCCTAVWMCLMPCNQPYKWLRWWIYGTCIYHSYKERKKGTAYGQRWRWGGLLGNSANEIVTLDRWETYYLLLGVSQGWIFDTSLVTTPHPLLEVRSGGRSCRWSVPWVWETADKRWGDTQD